MGNKGKKPWKLFGSLSHGGNVLPASATAEARRTPRSAPAIQQKPKEFVCSISGELMADPVILPNGQSYERSCIIACIDLHLDHATLSANHLPSLSPTTQLIPNLGLRSAIIKWCESNGIQYPDPIPAGVARLLVRNLISSQFHPSPRVHPHFSAHVPEISTPFRSPHHQMPPEFTPLTGDDNISSAADCGNISSQIIQEGEEDRSVPQGIPMEFGSAVLEEQIVTKLGSTDIAEQEVALLLLRHVTREHPEQRTDLCSRRLLSSLCPYLLSPNQSLQSNALAALINLSIHQSNKIPIVQSHTVPSLITAVDSAHTGTRSDAVAAIFSLSVVAENKSVIGELGAIPPLFHLLSKSDETLDTRRQAAFALHHLISSCPTNLSTLINTPGSAKTLLNVVLMESTLLSYWKKSTQKPQPPQTPFKNDPNEALCGYVMMVIGTMAGTTEGSTALTYAGAVETMVDMMKTLQTANNSKTIIKDPTLTTRRNQCVGVLSRLSRGSLRFHPLAAEAGAEQVLAQFCANDDDEGDNGTDGKYGSRNFKEKARTIISDLRRDGSATTGTNVSGIALPNRRAWGGSYLPRNVGAKYS